MEFLEGVFAELGQLLDVVVDNFPAPVIKGQKKWVNHVISILWFIGLCLIFFAVIFGIGFFILMIVKPFVLSKIGIMVIGMALLLPFIIALFFCVIGRNRREVLIKNLGKERITLRKSKFYFWIGVVGAVLLFIYTFWVFSQTSVNKKEHLEFFTNLVFLWVLIPFAIIPYLTWRIEFSKSASYLMYRNVIGRSYKINYKDILYYENSTQKVKVKTKTMKFTVLCKDKNGENFIEILTCHGIKRFLLYQWQKEENSLNLGQDQEINTEKRPKRRGRRFYNGRGLK